MRERGQSTRGGEIANQLRRGLIDGRDMMRMCSDQIGLDQCGRHAAGSNPSKDSEAMRLNVGRNKNG